MNNQKQEQKQDTTELWKKEAAAIDWITPFTKVKNAGFDLPVSIKWFEDGALNLCYNCVDRHLADKKDKVAFYFEPDQPDQPARRVTYQELYEEVGAFAAILQEWGVKKGDRVTIYMPMIPEAAFAMLACARIGAIHSVVFGGFSPESLRNRIEDCESDVLITADEGRRAGKRIHLKENVDKALQQAARIKKVLVVQHTGADISMREGRDFFYHDLRSQAAAKKPCEPVAMNAEDPLFILYTSGSTGKPKGLVHTTGGYLVYVHSTFKRVFDYKDSDVFWCTADVGWVTGHSYTVYGPLSNGATSVIFEGVPNYPDASRIWNVVDKYKVSILYTAPTAIRSLMKEGEGPVKKAGRKSLRVLGSVGEPINPEVWKWYHEVVGEGRCEIVDTWWQTETGGILISPVAEKTKLKPGSATLPLPGIDARILNQEGKELQGAEEGLLVMADSWPGQARTIFKDHERFEQTYFKPFPGYYFTGDGCRRDEDGYFWITGRVDDVINVSGHRLGSAELESAIVSLDEVSEAAVVGVAHDLKGQGLYAYVTLKEGVTPSEDLKKAIVQRLVEVVGPIAKPDFVQWAEAMPKTRSGKIMRRILRKIGEGHLDQLGDTSTLADPQVVEELARGRQA